MATNTINIRCDCGRTVNIALVTKEVNREARQMGAEVQYDTTGSHVCQCGNEIEYLESNWEYPEGVPNHQEGPHVKGGTPIG